MMETHDPSYLSSGPRRNLFRARDNHLPSPRDERYIGGRVPAIIVSPLIAAGTTIRDTITVNVDIEGPAEGSCTAQAEIQQ